MLSVFGWTFSSTLGLSWVKYVIVLLLLPVENPIIFKSEISLSFASAHVTVYLKGTDISLPSTSKSK